MKLFEYKFTFVVIVLLSGYLHQGCDSKPGVKSDKEMETYREPLIKVNKYLVKKYAKEIESYSRQRDWNMKQTSTGLWYMIYKKGTGRKASKDLFATVNYSVKLLEGTTCYSTDSLGPETFRIGQNQVESGLDEGILMMHEGDKARFILPPYLAHGLLGDRKKIPPLTIIIYDIELIKISQ
jgi:FKBP-type peptidyl-prolyl cis-trans isomerase